MYQVLTVTGYKPHEIGVFNEKHEQLPYLKKAIRKKLIQLKEEWDYEWVVVSGQAGVELWAAEAVISLKERYPDIKLAVLAPFIEQESKFPEPVKVLYESVWQQADHKDFITKRHYEHPSQLRQKNDFIVSKTACAMVLYDESTEGSPKYFIEAVQLHKNNHPSVDYPIDYLTPDDIEDLIREELDEQNWN
ncbi:DUF1273 domain-containing protein [Salisediminibacterium beveridgei]|uniref:Uncharacterized protein n=1 Tax=Salisediminibacterium beveridgei TaxID=632773 RepID=A0A1D7QVK2_9BACI|nr:DUF1273 domain-containing protein [Salisediminibacterium beveridgei]AOM83035.1 hypothetical protein BBEV_1674 [Salisediminibacterium beveridgei]